MIYLRYQGPCRKFLKKKTKKKQQQQKTRKKQTNKKQIVFNHSDLRNNYIFLAILSYTQIMYFVMIYKI